MHTDLTIGEVVYMNSGIGPKLPFVITGLQKLGNDWLACGSNGCAFVDLLRKVEPDAVEESTDDRCSRKVLDADYEQIRNELFIPYRQPLHVVQPFISD